MRTIAAVYVVAMALALLARANYAEAQMRGGSFHSGPPGGVGGIGGIGGVGGVTGSGLTPLPDFSNNGLNTGSGLSSGTGSSATFNSNDDGSSTRKRSTAARSGGPPLGERNASAHQMGTSGDDGPAGGVGTDGGSGESHDNESTGSGSSWWKWCLGIVAALYLIGVLGSRDQR